MSKVDHNLLKANQLSIIVLSLLAFIFNLPVLVGLVALVMLAGTALGKALLGLAVRRVYAFSPDLFQDNPEPHRFSQGLGGVFLLLATLALFGGVPLLGWGLVWMVIALAALNAFGGFCAGCFLYYWLTRAGVPGFVKTPPAGSVPGTRPTRGGE
jgi:hypothetical protein